MADKNDERGDRLKRSDLIGLLRTCLAFTDTGVWNGLFTYPNAGPDLVEMGLVTDDKRITVAGRAALYLLGDNCDPFPDSKSYQSFSIPLGQKADGR